MKNAIPNPNLDLEYALSDFSDYTHSAFLVSALHWAEQRTAWFPAALREAVERADEKGGLHPRSEGANAYGFHYDRVQVQQRRQLQAGAGRSSSLCIGYGTLGMARFPDQSQLNLLLRRMDEANLLELQAIQAEHLRLYERFSPSAEAEIGGERLSAGGY